MGKKIIPVAKRPSARSHRLAAIFLGSILFFFTGCVDADDFQIRSVEVAQVNLPSSATLRLDLQSRSRRSLQLLECALDVELGGERAVALVLTGPVVVPARFEGTVEVPLRMRVVDPLVALGVMGDPQSALQNATVSGQALIRAGGMRRKIRLEHYPLSKFIDTFTP